MPRPIPVIATYHPADVPWLSSSPQRPAANLGGALGVWVGFFARGGFGWASLLLPLLSFLWAARWWQGRLTELHLTPFLLGLLCAVGSAGTAARAGLDDSVFSSDFSVGAWGVALSPAAGEAGLVAGAGGVRRTSSGRETSRITKESANASRMRSSGERSFFAIEYSYGTGSNPPG